MLLSQLLRKTTKHLGQDCRFPSRDSNRKSPKYKSETLPLTRICSKDGTTDLVKRILKTLRYVCFVSGQGSVGLAFVNTVMNLWVAISLVQLCNYKFLRLESRSEVYGPEEHCLQPQEL